MREIKDKEFIILTDQDNISDLTTYIRNIEQNGILVQIIEEEDSDEIILALKLKDSKVKKLAAIYEIDLNHPSHVLLSVRREDESDYSRVLKLKGVPTTCEKIYLIEKVLQSTSYGPDVYDIGLTKLKQVGMIHEYFALHDGTEKWKDVEPGEQLNDRQVLAKNWIRCKSFFTTPPIDLIEKYFGPEISSYFAFAHFFNKMLIIASIVGCLTFILSLIIWFNEEDSINKQVCTSNEMLCPLCTEESKCRFEPLKKLCPYSKWHSVFDNWFTLFYTIFMLLWMRLFIIMWQRMQNVLKLRWDMTIDSFDTDDTVVHKERCNSKKYSNITNQMEPYEPMFIVLSRYVITTVCCLFLMFLVFLVIMIVIWFRLLAHQKLEHHSNPVIRNYSLSYSVFIACFLQTCCIEFFSIICKFWARKLTEFENPRTETEFETYFLYKVSLLQFVNKYAIVIYLAFFRGRFFTSPNELKSMSIFQKNLCFVNCITVLNLQIFFLMVIETFIKNVVIYLVPVIKNIYIKCTRWITRTSIPEDLPQWRKELMLISIYKHHISIGRSEMVVQLGFVVLFAGAFNLAPLCALINNVFQIQFEAHKLVITLQRPIPRRLPTWEVWNRILTGLLYLSTVTNAFLLGFTRDFIQKLVYLKEFGSYDGYVNSTFSKFDLNDYDVYVKADSGYEYCIYPGYRNPPGHEKQYHLSTNFWLNISWQFIFIFVFEHIMLFIFGFIDGRISRVPKNAKMHINMTYYQKKQKQKNLIESKKKKTDKRSEAIAILGEENAPPPAP